MSDVAVASATAAAAPPAPAKSGPTLWAHGGFSFKDLLDIVNPLQHLPIIGSIYRYLTGDEPSGGSRIIGDAIYGGPIGFGVSVATTILFNDSEGHDLGERVLAKVFGPRDEAPDGTATAVATNAAPAAPGSPASGAIQVQPLPAGSTGAVAANGAPATSITPSPPVGQPVAMNQLFRSPSPAGAAKPAATPAANTPEQTFLAQKALYQRQMMSARGADGTVLNNRPVPLELSGNLMPVLPPNVKLVAPTAISAPAVSGSGSAAASGAAGNGAVAAGNQGQGLSPIAQKMLDGLAKYEQLKKQQQPAANAAEPAKLDLAL
jgi:hypothetical protein